MFIIFPQLSFTLPAHALIHRTVKSILFLLVLFLLPAVSYAQVEAIPTPNEKAFLISSTILNEQRSIWIHLPQEYTTSTQSYPVLYLLDGEGHFNYVSELVEYLASYDRNRIPNMIVVAILNVDRTRDFTPIHSLLFGGKIDSLRMKTTGGGTKFLSFIQRELVPFIEGHYRTQPYRVLAAHSLGGLFGLYAKEAAPDLFQSNILMSPAIYGGNSEILTRFKSFLQTHPRLSGKLFISIGNENRQIVDSLSYLLKRFSPTKLAWDFQAYPDENHFSVTYKSMYDGLKFIYQHWFIDNYSPTLLTEKQLQAHFDSLSTEFGYAIKPPEELVNTLGYKQLNAGRTDAALELFRRNTLAYPSSWNAYDSLGEVYMLKGERQLAIESYEKSVSLNPQNEGGKAALKKLHQQEK